MYVGKSYLKEFCFEAHTIFRVCAEGVADDKMDFRVRLSRNEEGIRLTILFNGFENVCQANVRPRGV